MEYSMLLLPYANARYDKEAQRLALVELRLLLQQTQPNCHCDYDTRLPISALNIQSDTPLSDAALRAIGTHSLLYGFAQYQNGAYIPIMGKTSAYLHDDLPLILKYKGKTNEKFTEMMLNMALYAGNFREQSHERLKILDPMCGKATSLFIAANRGFDADGVDMNKAELSEAEHFFQRYLEYYRIKHTLQRESLTIDGGKNAAPCVKFQYTNAPKDTACLRLIHGDARDVRRALGREKYHAVVCDLPYGVQHAPKGGGLISILEEALPQWKESMKHGAACALAWNINILPRNTVRHIAENAGFTVMEGECFDGLQHWVEQAITRDLLVCVRT